MEKCSSMPQLFNNVINNKKLEFSLNNTINLSKVQNQLSKNEYTSFLNKYTTIIPDVNKNATFV